MSDGILDTLLVSGKGYKLIGKEDIEFLQRKIHALSGKVAWGVNLGVGSFITMEFGKEIQRSDEHDVVHGEWHLWIYQCAWYIESASELIAASEDDRSVLLPAVQSLEGRRLIEGKIFPPALETTFIFEREVILHLFPLYTKDAEHWMLYMPNNEVLTIGPGNDWYIEKTSFS